MGTRSTIKFYSEFHQEEPLVCIYQQFDGYIDGVGHELAEWLKDKKVINGISNQTMEEGYANGMRCLAAQFVKDFKTRIGNLYISSLDDEQEFNYKVNFIDGQLIVSVNDIFQGTPAELLEFNESHD